jgi:hypothetical protein
MTVVLHGVDHGIDPPLTMVFLKKTSAKPLENLEKTSRKPRQNTPKPNFPVYSRYFPGVISVELPVYRTV